MGNANKGVANGRWGEEVAVERLRREGLEIIERNVRPFAYDRRLEIDVVAYDPRSDTMIFVEVKQHSLHMDGETRLRSVDGRKKRLLRTACGAWRRKNHWEGGYRFDVIEVFGAPGCRHPEVDHIRHVPISIPRSKLVPWT